MGAEVDAHRRGRRARRRGAGVAPIRWRHRPRASPRSGHEVRGAVIEVLGRVERDLRRHNLDLDVVEGAARLI